MAKNTQKKANRFLSVLIIAAILGAMLFAYLYEPKTQSVSASTVCNRETAIAYAKSLVGKKWDVDNHSFDCVDLIKMYFRDVGGMPLRSQGDAWVYAVGNIVMPTGWTRQYVAQGYQPQAGDCVAWYSIGGNSAGHVAIVVSVTNNVITVVEQSTTLQCAAKYHDYYITDPTCYIHPDFEHVVPPTQPTQPPTTEKPTPPPTTTEKPTPPPTTTPAPCKHVYDSGVITKEASCQTTGIRVYTCTKCGAKKQETIPITDHHFSEYRPVDDFSHKKLCECGLSEEENHVFDTEFTVHERSCEADGIVIHVCSVCNATKSEILPMYGLHEFDRFGCIHCGMPFKRRRSVHSIKEYMAYRAQLLEQAGNETIEEP